MKVVVSGGAGFLGCHLLDWLAQHRPDWTRFCMQRPPGNRRHPGTLTVTELVPADVLVHLADPSGGIPASVANPVGTFVEGLAFTVATIERARELGIKVVVLASTCAVYGPVAPAASETQAPRPLSPYAIAKLAAEQYAAYASATRAQDVRVARIANAYGPGQRKYVIYDLATRALCSGQTLAVQSDGQEYRDFIHADDVAQGVWTIVERGAPGALYNVGSGQPVTVAQLARTLATLCGRDPDSISFRPAEVTTGSRDAYPDVQRLLNLGFTPAMTLAEGLEQTIDWIRRAEVT